MKILQLLTHSVSGHKETSAHNSTQPYAVKLSHDLQVEICLLISNCACNLRTVFVLRSRGQQGLWFDFV